MVYGKHCGERLICLEQLCRAPSLIVQGKTIDGGCWAVVVASGAVAQVPFRDRDLVSVVEVCCGVDSLLKMEAMRAIDATKAHG